jgi:hypothetical protein
VLSHSRHLDIREVLIVFLQRNSIFDFHYFLSVLADWHDIFQPRARAETKTLAETEAW